MSQTEIIPFVCLGQVRCSGLTAMGTHWTHGHKEAKQHYPAQAPLRDSLLDAVENQGATTLSGGGVRVVVQRVYSLPCRCQQGGGSAASPGSDPPKVRWVQDTGKGAYGPLEKVAVLPRAISWLHSPYTWVVLVFSCVKIWDTWCDKRFCLVAYINSSKKI